MKGLSVCVKQDFLVHIYIYIARLLHLWLDDHVPPSIGLQEYATTHCLPFMPQIDALELCHVLAPSYFKSIYSRTVVWVLTRL